MKKKQSARRENANKAAHALANSIAFREQLADAIARRDRYAAQVADLRARNAWQENQIRILAKHLAPKSFTERVKAVFKR